MAIEINNQGDCALDATGTAIRNCDKSSLSDLKGVVNINKGWFKAITDGQVDFDLVEYLKDVKGLKAFPLLGIQDFGQDTPENETNTSTIGVIQEVRAGKPQFSFMYTKGRCFQKALYNKRGQGRWDFALVFETGILFATDSTGTKLKGFDGGMFMVESYKLLQGTDLEMSTAKIQLLSALEWNTDNVFIPFDIAGDIGAVEGVIEVGIKVDPIVAGTTVTASITSACNVGDSILDLDTEDNFKVLTNGIPATPSLVAYNVSTGKYTFTVTTLSATDKVQVMTNDGTYSVIEDSIGNLYKGVSNIVEVA